MTGPDESPWPVPLARGIVHGPAPTWCVTQAVLEYKPRRPRNAGCAMVGQRNTQAPSPLGQWGRKTACGVASKTGSPASGYEAGTHLKKEAVCRIREGILVRKD